MSMFAQPLLTWLSEPWLALSRQLTVHTLNRRVRVRAHQTPYEPDPASMLYVAASSLPYHTSGYTTRTHEVICALRSAGARVHVLTRPGYPWDRKDRQRDADGDETMVDEVRYQHASSPYNNRPVLQYASQAAAIVADVAARRRVSVIHAASNHVNALPALLAARGLGVPFQYEMRGLWELTRASRIPHYEGSQAFRQGLELEGLVAREADRLFVISRRLGSYAQEHWGVGTDRIALLPNCVDPDRFVSSDPRTVERDTIGYAGSLIGYEGLDTLIDAIGTLRQVGRRVSVTVIGDGEARPQLEDHVQRLGLADRICFVGKMVPEAARERLSRCAVVCIPRKPFKVCEIIPPIKLVEALAMGKPVIVPDLPVFRDEMGDAPPGWFFKSGDVGDLAQVIHSAFSDLAELDRLGKRAREHVITQRCWRDFVVGALPVRGGA